jgi:hypothetical protein
MLAPLVVWEYHFFADSEVFGLGGYGQMFDLAGIGYSFDLEIEKIVEEVFDRQEGGSIADEFLMRFVEEHRLEYLEAFLAAVYLSVGEQPLLRRHRILDHLLLLLHQDWWTQRLRNCQLWTFLGAPHILDRIYCHQESLQHKNHSPSPHPCGRTAPSI